MSKVYLIEASAAEDERTTREKIAALWSAAGLEAAFRKKDVAALKLHVGEPGKTTHVSPVIAAALVDLMGASGTRPFLTDTAVLYKSPRDTGPGHAKVAADHGFGIEAVGAPFVPADGLLGSDEAEVPVGGRHFEKVSIASGILQVRSMLVLTHVTGHLATGMGAALKNLGMGCSSKKGKLRQHHGQQPAIDEERCTACGTCAEWCPSDAITVEDVASIDPDLCIGCGECIATCLEGAVDFDWNVKGSELQERMVEYAAAVVRDKPGRIAYVSTLVQVTRDCDCIGSAQDALFDDIGYLASLDPVAIDRAAHDLIRERAGRTLEKMSYPSRDASRQIVYAEQMGLGSASYDLVTVTL